MKKTDRDMDRIIETILSAIKNEQDYSEEDMHLFTKININQNEEKIPNTYFVRLASQEITLDFICANIFTKPSVLETTFEEWPIDFSKI